MEILRIGILGAGTMGKQLALLFAAHGMSVVVWNHRLQPNFQAELSRLALIQVKLGLVKKEEIGDINARISYSNNLATMTGCQMIVEAVAEDKEIKIAVLKQLAAVVDDYHVLATNTSTLSVTELASFSGRPADFLGAHFFNPAMSMRLIEVIMGELTSDDTLSLTMRILALLGKQPIVLPETPGFIVNRLLFPMINEAIFLLSEGVSDAKTIDSCMRLGANHPMGPLELADMIGLDICLQILETLMAETGDGKYRPAPLLKRYVRARKLGKKSGVGFYTYRTNSLTGRAEK